VRAQTKGHAAQACVDRFGGKPFALGRHDCVRLAAHLVRARGVKTRMLKGLTYRSLPGAVKALKRTGFADLAEGVDALGLPRIAPARAVAGDLVAMPGEDGDPFGCVLTVALGNGRVLGFIEGVCQALEPRAFVTAWRVP
jgi:hypothetical protein